MLVGRSPWTAPDAPSGSLPSHQGRPGVGCGRGRPPHTGQPGCGSSSAETFQNWFYSPYVATQYTPWSLSRDFSVGTGATTIYLQAYANANGTRCAFQRTKLQLFFVRS